MTETPRLNTARALLEQVPDPEIPALSVVEMGMIAGIWVEKGIAQVDLLPTYSGCPAVTAIADEIVRTLRRGGFRDVRVQVKSSPAWSTDFLCDAARRKLRESGIAPPTEPETGAEEGPFAERRLAPDCPYCDSAETVTVSEFGSTACKSLHHCEACRQPFEHFKRF